MQTFIVFHELVVTLFLVLFISKATLLFLDKHETLNKMRSYTKILDIVFGSLILISGAYLTYNLPGIPAWLYIKIALVLAAIPMAIIGIKKQNKVLTVLSLAMFIYIFWMAENKKSLLVSNTTMDNSEAMINNFRA